MRVALAVLHIKLILYKGLPVEINLQNETPFRTDSSKLKPLDFHQGD